MTFRHLALIQPDGVGVTHAVPQRQARGWASWFARRGYQVLGDVDGYREQPEASAVIAAFEAKCGRLVVAKLTKGEAA